MYWTSLEQKSYKCPLDEKKLRKLIQIWPYLVKIGQNLPLKSSILVLPEQSEVIIHGVNHLFGPATITRYHHIKNWAFQWQTWPKNDPILLSFGLKRLILLKLRTYLVQDIACMSRLVVYFYWVKAILKHLEHFFFQWNPKKWQIQ